MFASATSGDRPNNSKFSTCSIGNISNVLDAIEDNKKRNCFTGEEIFLLVVTSSFPYCQQFFSCLETHYRFSTHNKVIPYAYTCHFLKSIFLFYLISILFFYFILKNSFFPHRIFSVLVKIFMHTSVLFVSRTGSFIMIF